MLEDLKLVLVIPESPKILPLEDRPVEELSLDEARERIKHLQVSAYEEQGS